MKYCSESVSRKIAVLSTLATIAVVVIHSNSLEDVRDNAWAFWVGRAIASLQHWAIPFFFMVSGFFFDRFFEGKSLKEFYPDFLRKKVRSLVVPYVIWGGVFGFVSMTPLRMFVNKLHGDSLFYGTIFAVRGSFDVIDRIVGITGGNFIGAMWYIRLLLIIFIAAPLWIGLRRLSRYAILFAGLVLVFCFSSVTGGGGDADGEMIGRFCIQIAGIGWMLLGMAVSAFRIEDIRVPLGLSVVSGTLWCVMTVFVIHNRLAEAIWSTCLSLWFRFGPMFLVIALWGLYDYMPQTLPDKLPESFGVRFWVYCMHHPVTAWMGALVHAAFGHAMQGRIAFQILVAPLSLIVCIVTGLVVKEFMPKGYALLNGGR